MNSLGVTVLPGQAQNLFDCQHSVQYASYLFSTQDYLRAANEYERILFVCDSTSIRVNLLASYRLAGLYDRSFNQFRRLYPVSTSMPTFARHEYIKLLLLTKRYNQADSLLADRWLMAKESDVYAFKRSVLSNNWALASKQILLLDSTQLLYRSAYLQLLEQASRFSPKKAGLAGVLSAVIPGLGKVYAGDRKDAIVSLLFVGGLGFQAYRAFSRRGSGSVAGWLYASAGFGFYLGNIYGSVKAVRQYNQRRFTQFNNEARQLSFSDF